MLGVMALLYAEGGVARFYSGFGFALLQGRAPERRWRLAEAAARYAGQPWTGCGDAAATRRRCPKMFVADAAAATRRRRPKMFVADAQSRRRVSRRGARRPAVALRRHGRERGRPRRARGLQGAGAAQDGLRVRGPAREPRRKLRRRVPDDARSTRHTHKEQPPRLHAADAQRTDAAAPRGRRTKNTRRRGSTRQTHKEQTPRLHAADSQRTRDAAAGPRPPPAGARSSRPSTRPRPCSRSRARPV